MDMICDELLKELSLIMILPHLKIVPYIKSVSSLNLISLLGTWKVWRWKGDTYWMVLQAILLQRIVSQHPSATNIFIYSVSIYFRLQLVWCEADLSANEIHFLDSCRKRRAGAEMWSWRTNLSLWLMKIKHYNLYNILNYLSAIILIFSDNIHIYWVNQYFCT